MKAPLVTALAAALPLAVEAARSAGHPELVRELEDKGPAVLAALQALTDRELDEAVQKRAWCVAQLATDMFARGAVANHMLAVGAAEDIFQAAEKASAYRLQPPTEAPS